MKSLNPSYTGKRSLGKGEIESKNKARNGLNPSYTGKRSLGAPHGNCLKNNEL